MKVKRPDRTRAMANIVIVVAVFVIVSAVVMS